MADITGTFSLVDENHQTQFTGSNLRIGLFELVDTPHLFFQSGTVIFDTTSLPGDSTFIQDQIIWDGELSLNLIDSTFVDGSYSDGTYLDSTYVIRNFNPVWTEYSIWDITDSESLEGYRHRVPLNPKVGNFYANFHAPDPGIYQIRWRYQKDINTLVKEIREPFRVISKGISSDRT